MHYIRGHGAGIADFCFQFLAQDRGIGSLLHFCSTNPGETRGICNTDHAAAILKMNDGARSKTTFQATAS